MDVKSTILFAACIAASVSSLGETAYSYDENDAKIYIATVPAGETNAITEAAAGVLNGGGVTNFVKRGAGTLISNRDITSYTGGIRIEEGIFRTDPNTQANDTVGKLSGGGDIWVLDGATMELYETSLYVTHMQGKTTHIAGRGFGGRGALVACAGTVNQTGATFGNVTLEADALVSNEGNGNSGNSQLAIASSASTLNFNSHSLHFGGTGDVGFYGRPTFSGLPSNNGTLLDAIVSEGYGVRFNGGTASAPWNNWQLKSEIVLTNSTRLIFENCFANSFNWPIKMYPGTGFHVRNNPAWVVNTSYNTITDTGVVHLLDPDRNWIQFNNPGNFLQFKGKLTGGGLRVNTYQAGSGLYLRNKNNDFTNGIVATSCAIHIMTNGTLPAAGAPLSLTNAYAVFHSSQTYALPPLNAYGNCAVTNHVGFSPSGAWRDAVTKTGTGTLRYATLVGAPRLDFAALTSGLTFEVPDTNVFRTIPLAYESLQRGGTATAALNGANEVLVAAFLAEKIRFIDIQNTLLRVMDRYENTALDTIEDVFEADATARRMTEEVLSSL